MQKRILIPILTASLTTLMATSAQAIVLNFDWQGDGGYSANGKFSFDETTAPAIFSEFGLGPTKVLDSLTVSFFDPSDTLLGTYDNVVGGISIDPFLNFSFDTTTQELFGFLDIGEGTGALDPSRFFLYGPVGELLFLLNGQLQLIDTNSGAITVTVQPESVPEPISLIGLGLIGLAGFATKRKSCQ
ncbi:MAG: PEP-CTERM sorting domain-containing protein [Xenococcaceae cyanobacterium MO_234.B1]|nr:PEP-CTERM sorting domain-containing protein [Xenococcaceae cyanobacterium MO_234.B1]